MHCVLDERARQLGQDGVVTWCLLGRINPTDNKDDPVTCHHVDRHRLSRSLSREHIHSDSGQGYFVNTARVYESVHLHNRNK